jgi:hypothetical protein
MMTRASFGWLLAGTLFIATVIFPQTSTAQVAEQKLQIRQVQLPQIERAVEAPQEADTEDVVEQVKKPKPDTTKADTSKTATFEKAATVELPAQYIRLHLMDGSVISGDLAVKEIKIQTEFGLLTVPIAKIRKLTPGLASHPEVQGEVSKMIADLGGADFKARESAQKGLLKMGLKIRTLLQQYKNDKNAELKRRVGQILTAFTELEDEQDDLEENERAEELIVFDTIETENFTIVGKVQQEKFQISSKYGPLTIQLADIRMGQRQTEGRASFRKSFTVPGTNLVQRSFKNSGVKVQRGDRVSLTADGQIVMSPWGSNMSSTPDGGSNFGWYVQNKIAGGALIAKIGNGGEVFKVGSKHTFVAKKSGILQFAIAMQATYAGRGYNFPGQYNVKVRVEPGAEE